MIARNGFVGEFIEAAVARGGWQVDQLSHSRELRFVDILHADIQGFEVEMMDAARDALHNVRIHYLVHIDSFPADTSSRYQIPERIWLSGRGCKRFRS
jgi:hypothetical protein